MFYVLLDMVHSSLRNLGLLGTSPPPENGPGKFVESSITQPCIARFLLKFGRLLQHGRSIRDSTPVSEDLWKRRVFSLNRKSWRVTDGESDDEYDEVA